MGNECWTEQLFAHQLAYSFLSKTLYEAPTSEFICLLAEQELLQDWPLEDDGDATRSGLALLQGYCDQWDESQLAALNEDYARLFGGAAALLAHPWESVYRSQDHLVFEEQTLQVRQSFQRYGMPIPKLHIEPDDHIGLELRFIAYLCSAGLNSLGQNQVEQFHQAQQGIQQFLREHLLQWANEFLDKVSEHARTGYYRGLASLTRGSLIYSARVFDAVKELPAS